MTVEIRELVLRANITNPPEPSVIDEEALHQLRQELRAEFEASLRQALRNQRER